MRNQDQETNDIILIMAEVQQDLEQQCVDTIRTLSIDGVQKAKSGHPGMPMGMADVAFVLWDQFLRHNPQNPDWINRDRFILSAGHGSMLLYSLLYLYGYDLPLDELKNFRQYGSKTPGHPEYGLTPGVETTTGPLGQGFANGVGMAIAEAHMAAKFNQADQYLIDHYVYGIVSDGDLMEGISHEAASLAGHLKLGKLIYFYDDNNISIDGSTELAFSEDVGKRFEAYGWHYIEIDGHDRQAVHDAIIEAQSVTDQPTLIGCKTRIGYGSPNKEATAAVHGAPLGDEEVKLTKQQYNWDAEEPFYVPDEVLEYTRKARDTGQKLEDEWKHSYQELQKVDPDKTNEFDKWLGTPDFDWDSILPEFEEGGDPIATRKASGKILESLVAEIPNLLGGSADLTPSNNTHVGQENFHPDNYAGRYIRYGVREHTMGAILNGLTLYGGIIPYGGTFLIFSDYCRPAIRLAALSHIGSIYVFTHDSIGLGEDGPTHQPIEHLAALRAMPNLLVLRPADANETSVCWKIAVEYRQTPSALALTRQGLPIYERESAPASLVEKGAYTLVDTSNEPDAIILSSGSEVEIAVDAAKLLEKDGISARVVSMPCWELFREQPDSYREEVLPSSVKNKVAVEAASPSAWREWVGDNGKIIGLDHFGASAPYKDIYKNFGLTAENVAAAVKENY